MKIKRNNYEAFLLDQLEGRLSAEEQQELRDFLLLNPDCAMELEGSESWILEKSQLPFPAKAELRKTLPDATSRLNASNFDLFSIARMEGDLTREQESDHSAMVAENEVWGKEWQEWQRTRLVAEPLIFTGKKRLKRRNGRSGRKIWMGVISAAAAIALIFILFRTGLVNPEPQIAMQEEPPAPRTAEPVKETETENPSLREASPIVPVEKKSPLKEHAGLFSIKKNPEEPEPSEINRDSMKHAREEQVQPKPLRIAEQGSTGKEYLDPGSYDQISPLSIPASSIHLSSLSLVQIVEMDKQELLEGYAEKNEISIWTIANAGIKGINRITGADMALLAARDEEGDLSGFRFKAKRFSLTTPLDGSE